jgi:hypothetical protein
VCANNKCNLITLGGVNEVVLIVMHKKFQSENLEGRDYSGEQVTEEMTMLKLILKVQYKRVNRIDLPYGWD